MDQVSRVLSTLRSVRYNWSSEAELQAGIARVLEAAGLPFEREVDLGVGTIDLFGDPGIGIEVKIEGSPSAVARQVLRYQSSPKIVDLILVTAKQAIARLVEGRPHVHVVALWGMAFL